MNNNFRVAIAYAAVMGQGKHWTGHRSIARLTDNHSHLWGYSERTNTNITCKLHTESWVGGFELRIFLLWGNSANHHRAVMLKKKKVGKPWLQTLIVNFLHIFVLDGLINNIHVVCLCFPASYSPVIVLWFEVLCNLVTLARLLHITSTKINLTWSVNLLNFMQIAYDLITFTTAT